jgi:hypothetical protein
MESEKALYFEGGGMPKTKLRSDLRLSSPYRKIQTFRMLSPLSGRPARLEMRIRVLEEQNEKLSAYATRVKAEIDELKRVINRYH